MSLFKAFTFVVLYIFTGCVLSREADPKQLDSQLRESLVVNSPLENLQSEKSKLASILEEQKSHINQEIKALRSNEFSQDNQGYADFALHELERLLRRIEASQKAITEASMERWDQVKDDMEYELKNIEDDKEALAKTLYADLE